MPLVFTLPPAVHVCAGIIELSRKLCGMHEPGVLRTIREEWFGDEEAESQNIEDHAGRWDWRSSLGNGTAAGDAAGGKGAEDHGRRAVTLVLSSRIVGEKPQVDVIVVLGRMGVWGISRIGDRSGRGQSRCRKVRSRTFTLPLIHILLNLYTMFRKTNGSADVRKHWRTARNLPVEAGALQEWHSKYKERFDS